MLNLFLCVLRILDRTVLDESLVLWAVNKRNELSHMSVLFEVLENGSKQEARTWSKRGMGGVLFWEEQIVTRRTALGSSLST